MNHISLQIKLNKEDINKLIEQFHFTEDDYEMLSIMHTVALTVSSTGVNWGDGNLLNISDTAPYFSKLPHDFMIAAITLGKAFDDLINLYLENEKLREAYMLDCIGLKLLSKAYDSLINDIEDKTGKYIPKLIFPGDELPLSLNADICRVLNVKDIIPDQESFMLTPLKSACLILPLKEASERIDSKKRSSCDICTDCKNTGCPFRAKTLKAKEGLNNLNYGYRRIFKDALS